MASTIDWNYPDNNPVKIVLCQPTAGGYPCAIPVPLQNNTGCSNVLYSIQSRPTTLMGLLRTSPLVNLAQDLAVEFVASSQAAQQDCWQPFFLPLFSIFLLLPEEDLMSKALVCLYHRSSSIGEYSFLVLFLTCLPHQQLLAFPADSLLDPICLLFWLVERIVNVLIVRLSTSFPFWGLLHLRNHQHKVLVTFYVTYNYATVLSGQGSKSSGCLAHRVWNRVDCQRPEKRSKTHKILKRTLFN